MINCPHCNELVNEENFCFYCGKPLTAQDTPPQPAPPAKQPKVDPWGDPIKSPEMPAAVSGILAKIKPGRTLSPNPDMNDLKQRATSWLFLGFLISFSLYAIIELIAALEGTYSIFTGFNISAMLISKLTDSYFSMDYYKIAYLLDAEEFVSLIQSLSTIIRLICFVPTAFALYGVWHFYISSSNDKKERINLKGLKLIDLVYKYYSVIQFIYGIAATVTVAVAGIKAFEGYDYYNEEEGIQLIVNAVLVLAYYLLNFIYIIKFRAALLIVAKTVKNGAYNSKALISNFVIVWNIVLSVIALIYICDTYSPAAHLFEIISLVLITAVIIGYNKKVQGRVPKVRKSNSEFDFDEANI